jgi:hypothetical protein
MWWRSGSQRVSFHGWLGWKKGIALGPWEQMDSLSYLAHVCSAKRRYAPLEEVEEREAQQNDVIVALTVRGIDFLCGPLRIYVLKRRGDEKRPRIR